MKCWTGVLFSLPQIEELLLAYVDITVFVSCPKTKDSEELKTYFKVFRSSGALVS